MVDVLVSTTARGREAGRVARRTPAPRRSWRSGGLAAASIGACVVLWQLASITHADLELVTFRNVPSPVETAQSAWAFVQTPAALHHLGASLWRVLSGFAIAGVVGTTLGLGVGRIRLMKDLAMPPLEVVRPIPAVAWIPLAILMFRSSEGSMVFITFLGALFPVLLNTIHGVEGVDRRLVASARSLGAGPRALFTEVVLPAALPSIVTGLVIGMGTAWFCLVTAEMISGQYGIGYFTWMSYTVQDYPSVVVGMILIGLLGMGSSLAVSLVGDLFTGWRRIGAIPS
ncbi:MAG: ABC transporter permease [Caulobacteraceae bacterium]